MVALYQLADGLHQGAVFVFFTGLLAGAGLGVAQVLPAALGLVQAQGQLKFLQVAAGHREFGRVVHAAVAGHHEGRIRRAEDAVGAADLGRVRRDSLVQDPFCGSGTLVIESAQKALNLAPGLRRRFAAEHFDFVPASIWAEQRQKALSEVRTDAAFEGIGYDIDPAAVALANANAKLAGVGERCRFEVADVKDFTAADAATVLTNPPYGERLGDAGEAAALAKTLGQVWQRHPAQGLYAITADADFEQHFGKKAARRRKIYNGMIPCQLYMYFEQPKREKR